MKNKSLKKKIKDRYFLRIPIKTHVLSPKDDIISITLKYTNGKREQGDIIVLSESPVAITQDRAIREDAIKVGILAKILWRRVKNVKYGIGLRSPTSMQCAIDECGYLRIIIAAIAGMLGKLFCLKGIFYRIAGKQAALIDAAHTSPVKPYDETVIKGPLHTNELCKKIKKLTGNETVIMDINDIGGSWVIGNSANIDKELLEEIMKDNPQGQQTELTPICLVREIIDD